MKSQRHLDENKSTFFFQFEIEDEIEVYNEVSSIGQTRLQWVYFSRPNRIDLQDSSREGGSLQRSIKQTAFSNRDPRQSSNNALGHSGDGQKSQTNIDSVTDGATLQQECGCKYVQKYSQG